MKTISLDRIVSIETKKHELAEAMAAPNLAPDDFVRLLDRGGVSAVRIDPLRLGGLTPARKVALAAELRHVAVYPVRLPEVGAHLAAGVVYGRMCEYVDWFVELFAGGPRFEVGQLVVPDEPGLGLTVCDEFASRHRV